MLALKTNALLQLTSNFIWKWKSDILFHCNRLENVSKKSAAWAINKGNSRPITLDMPRINILKTLFSVKLAKDLTNVKILINLDETSFNMDTKLNYSWLRRGYSCSIKNVLFRGSINWVSAIATNGLCMNLFKYWTTTQKEIRWFIELVIEYLQKNQGIKPNEVGIILDNWAWHRARSVIEYCNNIDTSLYFILPYCPEMAPVEVYFSELKRKFIKTSQSNSLNLESEACINKMKLWVFSTDQA